MDTNKISFSPRGQKAVFLSGMRDGLPIGLGYFAVAFSLGIAAKDAGLSAFQGFLASLLTNASAGEHAVFNLIKAAAPYIEVALITLITNARYLLMGCALSQRMLPETPIIHRLLIGFDITDEIFGISIAQKDHLNPYYTYGAMLTSIPFWASGTALGIIMGNLLPLRVVSALSVSLYGMFIAIIIPPCKKDKVIACLVPVSFALSALFTYTPLFSSLSEGNRTIILTVVISAAVALLFPIKEEVRDAE
ncbi:MAG: AzlC family ABC transporter permease [Oscillospiraceae bacterium]|nr:AzlC family ABC transporter permease [Oscillospiraceae bacterium]